MTNKIEGEIERVVQSVNEWDDRTSPDDYPDHLLITSEELADILRNFADAITPSAETNLQGWTGNKCEPCKGHGVRMQDGEERRCPDCAGTGDEYGALSDPTDEINPYEQALRDAVEPFLDWLEQREEGAHIKEVREGLIGVEDVIPDDHVVLGAHLRAQKDQGVLTIGHFRRLQAAYDGNASPAPQPTELGTSPLSSPQVEEE